MNGFTPYLLPLNAEVLKQILITNFKNFRNSSFGVSRWMYFWDRLTCKGWKFKFFGNYLFKLIFSPKLYLRTESPDISTLRLNFKTFSTAYDLVPLKSFHPLHKSHPQDPTKHNESNYYRQYLLSSKQNAIQSYR